MIFSLKRSVLSIALLSLFVVAPSIAAESKDFRAYMDLRTSIYSEKPESKANVLMRISQSYNALDKNYKDCANLNNHSSFMSTQAVDVFDRIITNNDYLGCQVDSVNGVQVIKGGDKCVALKQYSLARMYNDLEQLQAVYGMLSEKQQGGNRKNAKMTRAEEFTKRQALINRAINARKNTKYGKLENAFLHAKTVVSHKATRVVTGAAALVTLGYLAHRKGLDRAVVSSVSNGAVAAYNTVLSEQARAALELAAQKSCHAVIHGSVIAWNVTKNATKKAGQVAVESAKRIGAYVVSLFKRRAAELVK